MALVGILSPTYQQAAFIGDCIRSVLAQTVQDWEMVVVDDGSDDGTPEIAESFNDPRIMVVRRAHEGPAGLGRSYAAAVARTQAPLLAILEGDDAWPATKLEQQLPTFNDPAVVLSYGAAGLMDEEGRIYARYTYAPPRSVRNNDPIGIVLPALMRVNFIVAVTVMIRRGALERIGGFYQPDGVPYVDHPTWLSLATTGRFERSPRVLGHWRRYAHQVTTQTWFGTAPNRLPYLERAAAEAGDLVSPEVRAALTSAVRGDAARQREEAELARARVNLLDGRWHDAVRIFTTLLWTGKPRTRAVAALGLLAAGARTDLERAIAVLGRHSLPSRRHSAAYDHGGKPVAGERSDIRPAR